MQSILPVRTYDTDLMNQAPTFVPTTNLYYAIVKEQCCGNVRRHDRFLGGGERVRTDDLLRARQALSQLSYTPVNRFSGGPGWTRTIDLTIISRVL